MPFTRLAVKNLDKRIDQFEGERWRDMGAVFLNFAIFTQPDGRLVIDPYDRIAKTMGVPMPSFTSLHKDKVSEIMRLLMDYVKSVRRAKTNIERLNDDGQANEAPQDLEVKLSESGYPLIPSNDQFDKLRKAQLDRILRSFLACHYSSFFFFRNIFNFIDSENRTGFRERLRGSLQIYRKGNNAIYRGTIYAAGFQAERSEENTQNRRNKATYTHFATATIFGSRASISIPYISE